MTLDIRTAEATGYFDRHILDVRDYCGEILEQDTEASSIQGISADVQLKIMLCSNHKIWKTRYSRSTHSIVLSAFATWKDRGGPRPFSLQPPEISPST